MVLIASCTEVSTVRFCLVVRFLTACFLAEALPCALRFAEIVFDFARAVLLAAVFFLFAADADFDLAWLCVLDDFFYDGVPLDAGLPSGAIAGRSGVTGTGRPSPATGAEGFFGGVGILSFTFGLRVTRAPPT